LIPEKMNAIAGTICNGRLVESGSAGYLGTVEQLEASHDTASSFSASLDGDPR
jgi:hypothetical protein